MAGTAIVAGVGPTIGEAVARTLHDRGYDVGLFARSSEFIDDLAADLGDSALAVPTDVTEVEAVGDGVETVREAFGPIEVLVLNATGGAGRPVDRASADRLRSLFDVRVAGSLACVQAAREDLRETRGTVIFSGTTFAEGGVSTQVEWGAVGPAAQGLATSLSSALDRVQVTYVRIGSQVLPAEQATDGTIPATDVAGLYLDLIDRESVETTVCEVSARE
jgi:NADP-dependent 3-hydroxy acid dehydrogenase YdfG